VYNVFYQFCNQPQQNNMGAYNIIMATMGVVSVIGLKLIQSVVRS